jgi:sugar phosphate isomerase/epimerase
MYVESGLGKVNPYASPEAPELRAAGDGDILLGFRRMMEACRAMDVVELWIGTANFKNQYYGYWCYDRFRTDVTWQEQLAASEGFLKKLAPIARDLGIHMNLETHEEITTFEVVRLVEAVGPDVMGITFDTGNVTHRGEDPVAAARRIAPYVRQTHLKDVVHVFADEGLLRQVRPCGQGLVDFETILPLLHQHNPGLNLSIENPNTHGRMIVQIYDPVWQASHPDLSLGELAELIRLSKRCEDQIASGGRPTLDAYDAIPFEYERSVWFIRESAAYLREVCQRLQLDSRATNSDR